MEIRLHSKDRVYTTEETVKGELVLQRTSACQNLRVSLSLIGLKTLLDCCQEHIVTDKFCRKDAVGCDEDDAFTR
ncbi:hypothetical protein N7517_006856 [Penicillium concentricum]|uniref:Uncharacterized protein n=1 Tax=Penicillium concentricum TaxID=293559 RepID=A0A9W9SB98_9EURO|nr:uncharacterized protein N7517_006856 [Penicillium concentricum]KAJ5374850.1 hypothetical protein N7517_006856 [Penicillium concentricum]